MSEKPHIPPTPGIEKVPTELPSLKRWVGWKSVWDAKGGKDHQGKWKKPPYSPKDGSGIGANVKYLDHWMTFTEALQGVEKHELDGIGFVFLEEDGYVGIDFDDCVINGVIHPDVQNWLRWFTDAYVEFSPSGTGIHIICRGKLEKGITAKPLPTFKSITVEAYSNGRYFTFTGQRVGGSLEIGNCQDSLNKLLSHIGVGGDKKINPVIASEDDTSTQRALSAQSARRIYKGCLEALREAKQGEGNAKLNEAAFFAARAFAAGALEGTELTIKQALLDIVTKEWAHPHPEDGARGTINSGWSSGITQPLLISEENEVDRVVSEFNANYFVVKDFGTKCLVCWEILNPLFHNSLELKYMQFKDFLNYYRNQRIIADVKHKKNGDEQEIVKSVAEVWLDSPNRRSFERVEFLPNQTLPSNVYNLWHGFAYEPKPGDCSLYLAHLRDNICCGNEEHYRWLIRWMAYAVRHPDEQGHAAIVFRGSKGIGKTFAAKKFGDLWGGHALTVSKSDLITGHFNSHLRATCVLIGDEAFYAGNRAHESELKNLVTGETIAIEAKFVNAFPVRNLLHIILISNSDWVVPATRDERRFFVLNVGDKRRKDTDYFEKIQRQLNNGGYEALLNHLLNEIDMTGFNIRLVPMTDALHEQMTESLHGIEDMWFEMLNIGEIPGLRQKDGTVHLNPSTLLNWAHRDRRWSEVNAVQLGRLFGKNPTGTLRGMDFGKVRHLTDHARERMWVIPPLERCRQLWNEIRYPTSWETDSLGWKAIEIADAKF